MAKVSDMLSSKFIKKDDLGTGIVYTIKSCKRENVAKENEPPQEKWVLRFDSTDKGLVLNNTKIFGLQEHYGDDSDGWIGKRIKLVIDPNVMFAGKRVGGIGLKFPAKAAAPAEASATPEPAPADASDAEFAEPVEDDDVPF